MSIFRVHKTGNYTVMSNRHLQEKEMSLKAIGLLSKMLALPDDWDYSVAGLVAICAEGESAIKAVLKELQQFGYLDVNKIYPNATDSGRIEYEYIVYEIPKEVQKQDPDFLCLENQHLEVQAVENHTQLNTKQLNTKNKAIPKGIGLPVNPISTAVKTQRNSKKAKDIMTMKGMTNTFSENVEVQEALKQYFDIRVKKRLEPAQWKIILDDLKEYAGKDSTLALAHIQSAIAGGYMQIIASWQKSKDIAKSKPSFDNTATTGKGGSLANMTAAQRTKFNQTLATDKDGKVMKF